MKKAKLSTEQITAKNAENVKKINEKISRGKKLNFSERNILKIIDKKNKK